LVSFCAHEFPQLAGERARKAIVQGITDLVHRFFPETNHLRSGQTTWTTVAKATSSSDGKTIEETPLVPVVLSILAENEATLRKNKTKLRELKIDAVGGLCTEADDQGGCFTTVELALLLQTTPSTISTYIRAYEDKHGQLLPSPDPSSPP
jgi:hypothetical protein